MKRFLKPTGQILTTAVLTSTALEAFCAGQAVPAPVPPSPPSDSDSDSSRTPTETPQSETVVPPEAVSSQEFTRRTRPTSPDQATPRPIQSPMAGLSAMRSREEVPLPRHAFEINTLPELNISGHRAAPQGSSSPSTRPSLRSTPVEVVGQHAPVRPLRSAQVTPQADPTLSSQAVDAGAVEGDSNTAANRDELEATREWLNATLSNLVERDRSTREDQLRSNLMSTAEGHLARRNVAAVRRIADNPALMEGQRQELLSAIADMEDSRFYPFLSADRARVQPTPAPAPDREWVMAQMSDLVSSVTPECAVGGSASAPATGDPVAMDSAELQRQANADGVFLSGSEFLAGVGQQAPSMHGGKRSDVVPVAHPASGGSAADALARRDDCTPTLGQNISGLTYATLSGYQWLQPAVGSSAPLQQMVFPLAIAAPITSRFGWRTHPIYGNRRFHFGIDFGAPTGTPVLAALPGRVQTAGSLDGYGLTVILENNDLNLRNLYAHMSRIAVRPGEWVEQGTVIGWVGSTGNSTGPHLHFEVHNRTNSGWVAVDPLQAAAQFLADRRRQTPAIP